jgi:hypothetical protein
MKSGGGSELDIYPKALLQPGERSQQLVGFRFKAEINIHRGGPPTFKHSGRSSGQINPDGLTRDTPERDGKRTNARHINGRAHARPRAQS